jgi:hypothetical protein
VGSSKRISPPSRIDKERDLIDEPILIVREVLLLVNFGCPQVDQLRIVVTGELQYVMLWNRAH